MGTTRILTESRHTMDDSSVHFLEVGKIILYFLCETSTWHLDSWPPRRHVVWRDSVGVEGSRSGLKSECADIFHQSFPWLLHHTDEPQRAKQLSMATTPLCVEFFRCRVDVLQSSFSRSTISIAVFCLQNLICLHYYFCWSGLYRSYVLRHIRLRSFAVLCG